MSNRKIVSVHSYRGGTGKSNTTANIAVCAMMMGKRVAVLDTDLQSPGIHVPFGLDQSEIRLTLVDFLWGKCTIEETAYDVTHRISPDAQGKCWLVPASMTTYAIAKIIEDGYDVNNLNAHFDDLLEALDLDCLLVDTHPGLNRETMLTTAISDTLIILIRPDQQDYYGTAVLSEVAKKLEIPKVYLVVNKVFSYTDQDHLRAQLTKTFGYEVIGMIPLSEDVARLESRKLFVQVNPTHEVTRILKAVTEKALA